MDVSSYFHALPMGVGARAWGMGGTQIALADSSDAWSWNPAASAGLARPAASSVFSWDRLTGDYDVFRYALPTGHTGSITRERAAASGARLQALHVTCPFRVAGRRLVAGVAYRRRLSLPSRTDAASLFRSQSLYRFDYDYGYKGSGTGGFGTISLSVASNLGHGIRAGATVHRWFGTQSTSYVESYRYSVSNYYGWNESWNEYLGDDVRIEMSGFSVDLGAQIAVRDKYFAGVVYRSATKADIAYSNAASFEDTHTGRKASASHSGRGTLALPSSIGSGFAVRLIPRLTIAVDQSMVFWSDAALERYARVNALGGVPQAARLAYPTQTNADLEVQSGSGRTSVGAEGDFVDAARAEAYHDWAVAFLNVTCPKKVDYYKFKDRAQQFVLTQRAVTGWAAPSPTFGVWTYMPFMNHEMFHLYSILLGSPTTFFVEGIAVAYQVDPLAGDFEAREKSGELVHDVARGYRRAGRLLPISQIVTSAGWSTGDFTVTYIEGGSFLRHVADVHGIEKMKQVFRTIGQADTLATVSARFEGIYGVSLAEAERQWLDFLDRGP